MKSIILALLLLTAGLHANPQGVAPANGYNLNAFGVQKVTNAYTLFSSKQVFGLSPFLWSVSVSGASGCTVLAATNGVQYLAATTLTAGTASGSSATVRTRTYWPYQPGKGQHFTITCNLWETQANTVKEWGAFDEENGVFFRMSGTAGLSVVIRSNVSGTVVDTVIPRSSWDDPLDGTGPSRYNLVTGTAQIWVIDYEWLGVGQVRWGIQADKRPIFCHIKPNTNVNGSVYMRSPNLPVNITTYNVGTAATASPFTYYCSEVSSDGGVQQNPIQTADIIRHTPVSVGSGVHYPLVSYRIKKGVGAERGVSSKPFKAWVAPGSTSAIGVAHLCFNCQVSFSGAWVSITGTALEYNATGTAITGTNTAALILDAGAVSDASGQVELNVPEYLFGNFDFPQTTADIWTVYIYTITNNDTWTGGIVARQFD